MLFNSIEFALFLPIVFALYWGVIKKNLKAQNLFVLAASYFFYGWWDWRFLLLIALSSAVDFIVGLNLVKYEKASVRKVLLAISIFVNIGFLAFFKYFDFFSESFAEAFTLLGFKLDATRLNMVLPVGISFYTFQTLSYTIDIYKKKLEPTKDPVVFFSFVAFFPQLVAGPIERASNLLPQFQASRQFAYSKAADGLRQILAGIFKKVVIADNCAYYVNQIYAAPEAQTGSTLVMGAFFFAIQVYGDFSGYSDIAIGTGRLFGFNLTKNFAFPYFARNLAEFWRRWHITLMSWFRDYLYIPLGGSRYGKVKTIRNVFIVFLISGLWHGANWTYVFFGFLQALYLGLFLLLGRSQKKLETVSDGRIIPSFRDFVSICITFVYVVWSMVFFRSASVGEGLSITREILSRSSLTIPQELPVALLSLIGLFIFAEWLQQHKEHMLDIDSYRIPIGVRWAIYYGIVMLALAIGGQQQEFVYFQF